MQRTFTDRTRNMSFVMLAVSCLLPVLSCVYIKFCIVRMLVCGGACVCVCVCVCACVRAYVRACGGAYTYLYGQDFALYKYFNDYYFSHKFMRPRCMSYRAFTNRTRNPFFVGRILSVSSAKRSCNQEICYIRAQIIPIFSVQCQVL